MIGKDGPRRYQIRKAYLSSTQAMQEVRSTDTIAFFRYLAEPGAVPRTLEEGASNRVTATRAREILESCYYPHVTKEVRRGSETNRTYVSNRVHETSD